MNKMALLKIVNPVLFILVVIQFLLLFVARAVDISWQYEFHEYNGYLIGVLAAMHLYLNFSWFKGLFRKKKK